MNLKNQPPIFVPTEHVVEIEKISKAALMDMVWDYAQSAAARHHSGSLGAIDMLREHRDMVLGYRDRDRQYKSKTCISIAGKQIDTLAARIPNIGDKL
jgi:hypothetical protein